MIQMVGLMWLMAAVFAVIGYLRGLSRELISLAGIVLALFTLFQFDDLIRDTLLENVPTSQQFFVQLVIFGIIVFFAYQTRALGRAATRDRRDDRDGRDNLQSTVLGALVGFLNGYLIWGSIWYFMDINNYPLAPYITRPPVGSPSAQFVDALPLYVLAGGPGGDGNLLALAVIILFVFVLILI